MQKSADIYTHTTTNVLLSFFIMLVCITFPGNVLSWDGCHDGKYKKSGTGCSDSCTYCNYSELSKLADEVGVEASDLYCPGFGYNGDTTYAYYNPHNTLNTTIIAKLKNDVNSIGCSKNRRLVLRQCSNDFNTSTKKYVAGQTKTSEGKTDMYNTCKLNEVWCPVGKCYNNNPKDDGSLPNPEECNADCKGNIVGKYCPEGWHSVDKYGSYWGVECSSGTIPNVDRTNCCACPDGFSVNTVDITVEPADSTKASTTIGPGDACVKESNKTAFKANDGQHYLAVDLTQCASSTDGVKLDFSLPKLETPRIINPVLSTNLTVSRPSCLPGQVAFNGACVACTSNQDWIEYAQTKNVYCPGVNTWPDNPAPVINQIEKCPKMMRPNYDLSDCECIWGNKSSDGKTCENIKLSKEDLKCGPAGCNAPIYKQCWTKKKTKSYMKCMGFD